MHKGALAGFGSLKRDLTFAVDPSLYPDIEGPTDSEVLFHLALTLGLCQDAGAAMAKAIQAVESAGHEHGVKFPMQGTVAVSDGVLGDREPKTRRASRCHNRARFRSPPASSAPPWHRPVPAPVRDQTGPVSFRVPGRQTALDFPMTVTDAIAAAGPARMPFAWPQRRLDAQSGRLDFERADQVASHLMTFVGTADKLDVTVSVPESEIAGTYLA